MDRSPTAIASLVENARLGNEQALATLILLVHDELRRLAAHYLRRERPTGRRRLERGQTFYGLPSVLMVRRIVAVDPSALNRRQSRNENHRTPLHFAVL